MSSFVIVDTEHSWISRFKRQLRVHSVEDEYDIVTVTPDAALHERQLIDDCIMQLSPIVDSEITIAAILVDIVLLEEDETDTVGIRLAKEIRGKWPNIPVLNVTGKLRGKEEHEIFSEATLEDVDGVLAKEYLCGKNADALRYRQLVERVKMRRARALIGSGLPGALLESEPTTDSRTTILILSALDEELDYLYEFPLEWSEPRRGEQGILFRQGTVGTEIDIIASSAGSMGLTASAILAAKAIEKWAPKLAIMVGICGGRKERGLELGDIVVANQTFHYQLGAFRDGKFERELCVENASTQVLQMVDHFAKRKNVLSRIRESFPRGARKPRTVLNCHIGPMASADLVVKDIEKLGEAVEADRKTIAVDMEGYAFMRAARVAEVRRFLVIKSVTDFADAEKGDEYREYCKYTSGRFAYELSIELIRSLGLVS